MKACSRCGVVKPLAEYSRRSELASGYRGACKSCEKKYRDEHPESARKASRAWVERNKDRADAINLRYRTSPEGKAVIKARKLAVRYGLTPEQWDALFERQGHRCGCCKTATPGGRGWHTDHDHTTGVVRGILCSKCNIGIGQLGDNVSGVMAALLYLQRVTRVQNIDEPATIEDRKP